MQVTLELDQSQIHALAGVTEIPFDKEEPYEVGAAITELLSTFEEFENGFVPDSEPEPDTCRDVTLHIPSCVCGMFINYVGIDPDGSIGMTGLMVDDDDIKDGAELTLYYGPICDECYEGEEE